MISRWKAILIVAVFASLVGASGAFAQQPTAPFDTNAECLVCHSYTAAIPIQTPLDFTAPAVDYNRCLTCHFNLPDQGVFRGRPVLGHLHSSLQNCAGCHDGYEAFAFTYPRPAVDMLTLTQFGWFQSAASLSATPGLLHEVHISEGWVETTFGLEGSLAHTVRPENTCSRCHASAACSACHVNVPLSHENHAIPAYPAVTTTTTDGMVVASRASTCINPACHSVAVAASTAFVPGCTAVCHPGFERDHARPATWNWRNDYYAWTMGGQDGRGTILASIGANPYNPGVHGNYLANTAKCGVCHSVHRARGDGVMLLNTGDPTCAGCHLIGSTVTDVVVNWGVGPHGAGDPASCQARACHLDNPHGANGSQYAIVSQKLLNPATDALLVTAVAEAGSSGISTTELNAQPGSLWPESTRSLVRTGYNCNICHSSTQLAVVNRGWAEPRHANIDATAQPLVLKQGHIGVAGVSVDTSETWRPGVWHDETTQTAFAPVSDCESCHDQTDDRTRTGFTFPHGQTPVGASNLGAGRALLWMGWSGGAGATLTPITTEDMKAYDGNCLKCHRTSAGDAGVGVSY